MTINSQIKQFNEKLRHSYRKIINDVKKRSRDPLNSDKCDCGEASLYSALFRCDIPYAYCNYLGKEFPQIPDVELELSKQFNELVPDIQEDKYKRKEMEHNYIIKIIVNTKLKPKSQ
ncbi:hypothetical protein M9Y10_000905 [Tritrichomonas musculus]|uniref:Uncharacterized protein n=1 Tax=Tritrichomonas musculus TaxID=1915356 RepID=A0ABR2L5I1_9EUKA